MLRSWFSTWGRPLRPLVGTLPLLMGFCLLVERSPAQWDSPSDPYDPSNLVRVEEDWILLLAEPDANLAAPQLSTQMIRSPDASRFCNFNINFCDIPAYAQGGMQVEAWQGDTCIAAQTSENRNTLGTPNELVTWTQYLQRTDGNTLRFGIGTQETPDSPYYPGPTSSDTWGDFSGVSIDIPQGGTYLGNYSTDYSVVNSGITFGANRVMSLVLLRVRKYYANGNVETDDTPRVVYSQAQGNADN